MLNNLLNKVKELKILNGEVKPQDLQQVEYSKDFKSLIKELKTVISNTESVKELRLNLIDNMESLGLESHEVHALVQLLGLNEIEITFNAEQEEKKEKTISELLLSGRNNNNKVVTNQQMQEYITITNSKNVKRINVLDFTYNQLESYINMIKNYYAPSIKQKYLIVNTCTRVGIKVPIIDKMSGGREGTGSQFIEELFTYEKTLSTTTPPTEKQIELIIDLLYCPFVSADTLEIERIKEIEGFKVYCTDEELKIQLIDKVNKSQASEFIEMEKPVYLEWKKTRLTVLQEKRIKQLSDRLGKLNGLGFKKTLANNMDMSEEYMLGENNTKEYNPKAYDELQERHVGMLSKESASQLINQMTLELNNKSLSKFSKEELGGSNARHQQEDKVDIGELKNLNDSIRSLYNILGQQVEDDISNNIYKLQIGGNKEEITELKNSMKELVNLALDFVENNGENLEEVEKSKTYIYNLISNSMLLQKSLIA